MPSMVVAEKDKTEDWCRSVLLAVTQYMGHESGEYHSNRTKDIRNYQIYNGQLSQGDYSYITEQYGLTYPARLVNYPIIAPKIDLLIGEELRSPSEWGTGVVHQNSSDRLSTPALPLWVAVALLNQSCYD